MINVDAITKGNEIEGGDSMNKIKEEININEIKEYTEEEIIKREIEAANRKCKIEKEKMNKSKERDGLRRLVEDRFGGNMTTCARAARVSTSTVSRVINGETRMGGRLLRGIMGYIERNELQYSDYFSFN